MGHQQSTFDSKISRQSADDKMDGLATPPPRSPLPRTPALHSSPHNAICDSPMSTNLATPDPNSDEESGEEFEHAPHAVAKLKVRPAAVPGTPQPLGPAPSRILVDRPGDPSVELVIITSSVLLCARRTIPVLVFEACSKYKVGGRITEVLTEYHWNIFMSTEREPRHEIHGLAEEAQGRGILSLAIRHSVLACGVNPSVWDKVGSGVVAHVFDELSHRDNWQLDPETADFLYALKIKGVDFVLLVDDPRVTVQMLHSLNLLSFFSTPPLFTYNPSMATTSFTPHLLLGICQRAGRRMGQNVMVLGRDINLMQTALDCSLLPVLYTPSTTSHFHPRAFNPLHLSQRDTPIFDNVIPDALSTRISESASLKSVTDTITSRELVNRSSPNEERVDWLKRSTLYPDRAPSRAIGIHEYWHNDTAYHGGALSAKPAVRRFLR